MIKACDIIKEVLVEQLAENNQLLKKYPNKLEGQK
jgi:hypothetical protein